jgi:predicted outer membrane repeat protein
LLALAQLNARVIFVKSGGTGNGASWEQACDLQAALAQAKAGDEIWVAAGKYLPTRNGDRTISFNIHDGVKLYGGFVGFEADRSRRNWNANRTILSGEIGSSSIDDNSYSVVYTKGVSSTTVVDGFTITGGTANGASANIMAHIAGAGWFNDGNGMVSSPTIKNCTFINNYGRYGAGIYNYAMNGVCNPSISDCRFISNRADLDGGAIYNDGNNGKCSPKIQNCYFEQNEATYGAGIMNRGANGETKPVISDCVFISNHSVIRGGGIYNHREDRGICDPIISACRFEQNGSMVGHDISSTTNNEITTNKEDRSRVIMKSSGY